MLDPPRNNTIDLFEIYFQDEEPDHMPEILNLKTIALFKDPSDEARSVTKIGALTSSDRGIHVLFAFQLLPTCSRLRLASRRPHKAGGLLLEPPVPA